MPPRAAKGRLSNTKLGKAVVPLSSAIRVDAGDEIEDDDAAVPAPTWTNLNVWVSGGWGCGDTNREGRGGGVSRKS